ncbi:MAG: SDR family oxidoreductase [Deltaproteobacteria bacterium]|nr:SDR family oxidoreductase [Deltaproteobacteria bacterium]
MQLRDKVILITGASSGIGAAAARLFASEGAKVVLGARRKEALEKVAADVRGAGGEAEVVPGDVTDPDYAGELVERAEGRFGGLDGAFNNAGAVGSGTPVADTDQAAWDEVIATNLSAAYWAARAQIPALRKRGGGSMVFTTSFVGHTAGIPGMGAYAAAKSGVNGLVKTLAAELGAEGIRANALLPGGTRTGMAGDDASFHEWVASIHALKRMAEPDEIARAALFLIGPASSFVTGTAMLVDGGNSITKT